MALRTPPAWLQAGSYTAENDRLVQQATFNTTGIIGSSSMAVTQQGSPNMTVNVAAGWAAILGQTTSTQGVYVAYNDATYIATLTAADAVNPRIDRIVATVSDAAYTGSTNQVVFTVLTGTAAPSPTAPATPSNSISLCTIAVAANTTTITNANITDTRVATVSNLTSFPSVASAGTVVASGLVSANAGITTASATKLTLGAGSNTVAPLQLTSGTNLTSAASGSIEYDGSAAYFTPVTSSGRGSIAAPYVYVAGSSSNTSTPGTAVTPMFPGMTNGLQVQANTLYDMEIVASWNITVSTTKSATYTLGGTATYRSLSTHLLYNLGTGTGNTSAMSGINLSTGTLPLSITTNTSSVFVWKGQVRVNAAGYFLPTMTFSVAPGTYTLTAGSYIKMTPVFGGVTDATSAQAVGAWS